MINACLEIKPIIRLLLKNYVCPHVHFFPLSKPSLNTSGEQQQKKINSQWQKEPEKATMETYFTKHY